jgi:hypothetical protein
MTLRLRPLFALTAALALGGCGSSATTSLSTHRLAIGLDEYRILPRKPSLPAGPLRITVANHGILTHNLTIALQDRDSNGNRVVLATTSTLMPGASTVLTPTLRPGRYSMSSTIANQADLGMSGTLIVR